MNEIGITASRIAGNPRGSGYRRANLDWYVEPVEATLTLLDVEQFDDEIYDPACGCGNILKACRERGHRARGTDIVDRGSGEPYGLDFIYGQLPCPVSNIISNPPFGPSLHFAKRALRIATRKVALIQRLCWLEGQKRSAFLESAPLARVWVFKKRICMPPGEKRDLPAKGGFIAYAWFVFEHDYTGKPELGWI